MTVDDRFTQDFSDGRGERLLGKRNEIITGPVSDWATDFSHLEPEWAADPYPIQDELRQQCPIARTDRCRRVTRTWRRSPTTPTTSPRDRSS
jgi:hypothetical protein